MSNGLTYEDTKWMLTKSQYNRRIEMARKAMDEETFNSYKRYVDENYFVVEIVYDK